MWDSPASSSETPRSPYSTPRVRKKLQAADGFPNMGAPEMAEIILIYRRAIPRLPLYETP